MVNYHYRNMRRARDFYNPRCLFIGEYLGPQRLFYKFNIVFLEKKKNPLRIFDYPALSAKFTQGIRNKQKLIFKEKNPKTHHYTFKGWGNVINSQLVLYL